MSLLLLRVELSQQIVCVLSRQLARLAGRPRVFACLLHFLHSCASALFITEQALRQHWHDCAVDENRPDNESHHGRNAFVSVADRVLIFDDEAKCDGSLEVSLECKEHDLFEVEGISRSTSDKQVVCTKH